MKQCDTVDSGGFLVVDTSPPKSDLDRLKETFDAMKVKYQVSRTIAVHRDDRGADGAMLSIVGYRPTREIPYAGARYDFLFDWNGKLAGHGVFD